MKFDLHSLIIMINVDFQKEKQIKSLLNERTGVDVVNVDIQKNGVDSLGHLIKYPSLPEFVVVSMDGISYELIEKMVVVATKNFYNLSFVMSNEFANSNFNDLKSLKSEVSKVKGSSKINVRYNVFDAANINNLEIKDVNLWKKSTNKDLEKVLVIGDIHEDVDALKRMIAKIPKNYKIISVGDYLDKGGRTKEIIELMHDLKKDRDLEIVIGNHESFVARRLRNEIPKLEHELKTFSSLNILYGDEKAATKFLDLYDQSLPFLSFEYLDKRVHVSHAPCKEVFLGKMNDFAQKSQRNFYFKNREMSAMEEELSFVADSASESNHLHVFGHVAHSMDTVFMLNKIWLDTGSVYGNKLSGLLLDNDSINVIDVNGTKLSESDLFKLNNVDFKTKFKKYF